MASSNIEDGPKPICVDLDGTLLRNDVTALSIKSFIRKRFINLFRFIFLVIVRGWAQAKRIVALEIPLEDIASQLGYNKEFLDYLIAQSKSRVRLFLATASDEIYAKKIAADVGIFDGVFASNGEVNLAGECKANTLCMIFGERGFVYAGNSRDDVAVWNRSFAAILVNPTKAALDAMAGKEYMLFD